MNDSLWHLGRFSSPLCTTLPQLPLIFFPSLLRRLHVQSQLHRFVKFHWDLERPFLRRSINYAVSGLYRIATRFADL